MIDSQGDSVHFVQSVLFAPVHNRCLLPEGLVPKHVPCENVHAKWYKSGQFWGRYPQGMTTTIDIVLFDGVDELDAVGPLEVLRGAAAAGTDLAVRLVTRELPLEVTGHHGLRMKADAVYQL